MTTRPTPCDLDTIEARVTAAKNLAYVAVNATHGTIALKSYGKPTDKDASAAEHILEHAHIDLPALVADLRATRQERDEARADALREAAMIAEEVDSDGLSGYGYYDQGGNGMKVRNDIVRDILAAVEKPNP